MYSIWSHWNKQWWKHGGTFGTAGAQFHSQEDAEQQIKDILIRHPECDAWNLEVYRLQTVDEVQ